MVGADLKVVPRFETDSNCVPRERPRERKNEQPTVSDFFLDFSERTTAHGLRYAVSPDVFRIRRMIWLVVFLTTLGYLLYQLLALYVSYFSYPFKTVNKVIPQLSIPYPVLTLCDLNQIDDIAVNSSPFTRALVVPGSNVTYSDALRDIVRVAESRYWQYLLNATIEDYRYRQPHATMLKLRYKKLMQFVSRSVPETFRLCFWQGVQMNCSDIIADVFMEDQNCFQFNGRLGGGRVVNRSGYEGGFQAVLTTNSAEYSSSLNSDAGYLLFLHDDPDHAYGSTTSMLLSPGFYHHISIQKHTYSFLPHPFKAFGDQYCEEARKQEEENTTVEACLLRKVKEKTSQICGCHSDNCTIDQYLTCFKPTMREIYFEGVSTDNQGCLRPCHMQDYQPQMSLSYFPSESEKTLIRQLDSTVEDRNVRKHYLGLRLNFKDMIMRESKHVPEQDSSTLFGVIGGNMGLFLGISILTLVEIVEFIFILVYRFYLHKRAQGNIEDTEQNAES